MPLPPVNVMQAGAGRKGRRKCPLGIFLWNIFRKCTLQCTEGTGVGGTVPASRRLSSKGRAWWSTSMDNRIVSSRQQSWKVVSESRAGWSHWSGGLWGGHGRLLKGSWNQTLGKISQAKRIVIYLDSHHSSRRGWLVPEKMPPLTERHTWAQRISRTCSKSQSFLGEDSDQNTDFFVPNPILFPLWERWTLLLQEDTGWAKRKMLPLGHLRTK